MNRRSFSSLLGLLPFYAVTTAEANQPRLVTLERANQGRTIEVDWAWGESFSDVNEWLSQLRCKQMDGSPTAMCCETGRNYRTISVGACARHGDDAVHERLVARRFQKEIADEIEAAMWNGTADKLCDVTVFWRTRPEYENAPRTEYDPQRREDVIIPGWSQISAYARLSVAA